MDVGGVQPPSTDPSLDLLGRQAAPTYLSAAPMARGGGDRSGSSSGSSSGSRSGSESGGSLPSRSMLPDAALNRAGGDVIAAEAGAPALTKAGAVPAAPAPGGYVDVAMPAAPVPRFVVAAAPVVAVPGAASAGSPGATPAEAPAPALQPSLAGPLGADLLSRIPPSAAVVGSLAAAAAVAVGGSWRLAQGPGGHGGGARGLQASHRALEQVVTQLQASGGLAAAVCGTL
jgi:hypothetical protein